MTNINTFIHSLNAHRSTMEHPMISDGIIDCSAAIAPLRSITREGRAMISTDEYAINGLLGDLLVEYIPLGYTEGDMTNAVIGLCVLVSRILTAAVELKPDLLKEEILKDAANQDELRKLIRDFSAVPMFQSGEDVEIGLGLHEVLSAATPLTIEATNGFIERNIARYLDADSPYSVDSTTMDFEYIDEDEQGPEQRVTKHFDVNTIEGEVTVDPLNGFDEFYEQYFHDIDRDPYDNE